MSSTGDAGLKIVAGRNRLAVDRFLLRDSWLLFLDRLGTFPLARFFRSLWLHGFNPLLFSLTQDDCTMWRLIQHGRDLLSSVGLILFDSFVRVHKIPDSTSSPDTRLRFLQAKIPANE